MRKILLVEDSDESRRRLAETLEQAGFDVRRAKSGMEALRMFESGPTDVDLLVTDAQANGMEGFGLASRIRQQRPGLPVLYISGGQRLHAAELVERVTTLLERRKADRRSRRPGPTSLTRERRRLGRRSGD
jgi:CheY-like chemotaxis protein